MSAPFVPEQFVEKYFLARDAAMKEQPDSGLCGLEVEWNLLDSLYRPLSTVGSYPVQQSFVDYMQTESLTPWLREFSQLEIFHWMVEWASRPYYSPKGAIYEARLIEAVLLNALEKIGKKFGEKLYSWHGNIPAPIHVDTSSIPQSWDLAKRRYLERCVSLYGDSLATAGIHSNLSLPEPMLAWDFMHLPEISRGVIHLDAFKNEVYITGTRIMRAFACLFIATGASTPLQVQERSGKPVVVLTENDSIRNLTFPNPQTLDQPDLYRSYQDYLQISYDLVKRQERFGNNNWTPVRARSFAEPVERLIAVTSEQLEEIYTHGLYAIGEKRPVEDMARQIEIQNLLARINLPMDRVEVRTDDGGNPLDVDVANLTLKHLLQLRIYADETFARSFRYDREDINRARQNEEQAARDGLRATIENPLTGKPVALRDFLGWVLAEVQPLAVALQVEDDLEPLIKMARGGPNTAERLRVRLKKEVRKTDEIPLAVLRDLSEDRMAYVARDVETITERLALIPKGDADKLSEFVQHARDAVHGDPQVPIRFRPRPQALVEFVYTDKTSEIVQLASQLISIPSVTASPNERLEDVHRAAIFIYDYLRNNQVPVKYLEGKYPAVYAHFPVTDPQAKIQSKVMFSGHFDVVEPEPDDSQFEPFIEGDYLWGRGSADMKTVVATYLVWFKDRLKGRQQYPPFSLLLVGNEENGEAEPMGTPHALATLKNLGNHSPELFIAGERTEEQGSELFGEICVENRGIMRFEILAHGIRGHSGVAGVAGDLSEKLITARLEIMSILQQHLTMQAEDHWKSQVRFPFIQIGTPGIYNVTPDQGVLGGEIRSIPQDRLESVEAALTAYCNGHNLTLVVSVKENGVICSPENSYLKLLSEAYSSVAGTMPKKAKKLPGTSARFAPSSQGIVWGQSGIGPHSAAERHFLPSILPYYKILDVYADRSNELQFTSLKSS